MYSHAQYFIDRNPKYFDVILDWLRTSRLSATILEKPRSNTAELQDLREEAEYYSLSSLHEHLSTLISGPKATRTHTSYPRSALLTVQSPGLLGLDELRPLLEAGFELKGIRPSVNGFATLQFTSSKSLRDSTVSRLEETMRDIGDSTCGDSNYRGCRFSLI